MQASRRNFIGTSTAAIGAVVLGGGGALVLKTIDSGLIRLTPIAGEIYSDGMLKFMKEARFDRPAAALAAIRSQRVRFALEFIE